jgi:hypothetical protein
MITYMISSIVICHLTFARSNRRPETLREKRVARLAQAAALAMARFAHSPVTSSVMRLDPN